MNFPFDQTQAIHRSFKSQPYPIQTTVQAQRQAGAAELCRLRQTYGRFHALRPKWTEFRYKCSPAAHRTALRKSRLTVGTLVRPAFQREGAFRKRRFSLCLLGNNGSFFSLGAGSGGTYPYTCMCGTRIQISTLPSAEKLTQMGLQWESILSAMRCAVPS